MDRFLIAPFNSGLQKNLKPWLIPDDAFEQLINAFAGATDKRMIARVEKWKNPNWRNKMLKRPKVIFNNTEI